NEIISKYDTSHTPAMFVNHGVSDEFIRDKIVDNVNSPVQVGLSGNFLRPDIDWRTLEHIIVAHPNVVFNFFGAYNSQDANLSDLSRGNADAGQISVANLPNTRFHGAVIATELARQLKCMDCFLICYDIDKDQSKGTNYHKVLEYIATGKVTVSNNITTYANHSDLVAMPQERNN